MFDRSPTIVGAMSQPSPAPIDHLLRILWQVGGSDLMLTAGSPPLIRIDGALRPMEGPALNEDEIDQMVTAVLGPHLNERFRRHKQVDFAFSWDSCARLRGNAFL